MICLAAMMILIGVSPALSQEIYEESGEIQSDPTPDTSEEVFRLKLQTDNLEDSNQLKTIRDGKEYDIGKIFSHLQISHRPRPVLNLRPNDGHVVIHKQNNKHNEDNHAHYHEYIPIKIPSDTEYVIKPQHSSHNHHHYGEFITKPEIQNHHYNIPGYSSYHGGHNHGGHIHGGHNHGDNNHGYNNNGYNENGHSNHDPNNHEYGYNHEHNHGQQNHEFNSQKYPYDLNNHHGKPHDHYHASKPYRPYSHPPRPSIESHSYEGHYSKPHESFHGDYKPHYSHGTHGEHNIHHYYNPYYFSENHDDNGHFPHKYHEKPHPEYDSHHNNHQPFHNGYEDNYNDHSMHDLNKFNNKYEVHEHEDNNHHHRPSNYHANHKPHHQQNSQHNHNDHYNQHASSHKPTSNIHKPSKPINNTKENYHHKPSNPINIHASHGLPHKHEPHNHGNVWKPNSGSVHVHKIDKHKDIPKYYQQENRNEQIKSQLESLINEGQNEVVINLEMLESGSEFRKNTTGNDTKEDSVSNKPFLGSFQIKKNTTHVGSSVSMNSHANGNKINKNTNSSNLGENSGGYTGNMLVTKNENTNKPSDSHDQNLSRPSSHKNQTSQVAETNSDNGNLLNPHPITSYENQKPNFMHTSNRPAMYTIHESGTQSNSNRHDQLVHTVLSQKPLHMNNYNHEHHNNNYEVTEPAFETHPSSNEDSTSIEENSYVHKPLLFKPNIQESSASVDHSQEHIISSLSYNGDKPYNFIEQEHGSSSHNDHNSNIHLHHHGHQNTFHENLDDHYQNHMQNGQELIDISGETHHQSNSQDGDDQTYYSHGHHGYNPHRPHSYSHKPNYKPFYHETHHHDQFHNGRPNKCSSSHEHQSDEYHTEPYRPYSDKQNSHGNHHNFYGKPVNNHHTHQVSKPFNIDHGSPFGVSGIFINNFKKRPYSWFDDGDSSYNSLKTMGDDYQEDYRVSKASNGVGDVFEKNMESEAKENFPRTPQFLGKVSKSSKDNISENPHSRRHHYVGFDTLEEKYGRIIPNNFIENSQGGMPLTPDYVSIEGINNELHESEKALAYAVNPSLYTYVSRPHTVHHGLQQTAHLNFPLDPNHYHHSEYNHIQPHYGHQSNDHKHVIQTPYYHHPPGFEAATHSLNHYPHNPHMHNVDQHDHVNDHAELGTPHHNQHSNDLPVKYVYIPVLYNFQPHSQEHHNHLLLQNANSNTFNPKNKLKRSNAELFNRLALSEFDRLSAIQNKEHSTVVKPALDIFKAPIRVSPELLIPQLPEIPEETRDNLPLLLELLISPQLVHTTFTDSDEIKFRDGKEYFRRIEPLENDDIKSENDKIPSTTNWHQTQELQESYASKCKDIWENILLAQKDDDGIKKQGQLLSRSYEEGSIGSLDLKRELVSLDSQKKGSNTLEPGSGHALKESLESTCIDVLKNALLSQLEIIDNKRREENNSNQYQSQLVNKSVADKEKNSDTESEVSESGSPDLKIDEHKKADSPIIFENEEHKLYDREDEQKTGNSSQDYHW